LVVKKLTIKAIKLLKILIKLGCLLFVSCRLEGFSTTNEGKNKTKEVCMMFSIATGYNSMLQA
jgi:hypothetical protein